MTRLEKGGRRGFGDGRNPSPMCAPQGMSIFPRSAIIPREPTSLLSFSSAYPDTYGSAYLDGSEHQHTRPSSIGPRLRAIG
jgi:hypothetical protein